MITYRKMQYKDAAQVQRIDKLCFKHNWSLDAYEKEMDNPLATYIVAEDKDQVIGFGGYWLIIDEAHITNLAVLKAYRKKGIGQQIFDKLAETIVAVGCKKTTLEVREDNFSAIAFYQKNDFVEEGIRFHYYEENSHALIMWRRSYED